MKFRFARHTNRLNELAEFYINIIGLDFLGEFKNHSGYDGIFIGKKDQDWHLEFTQTNEPVNRGFDEDDILVFYVKTQDEFDDLVLKIDRHKVLKLKAKNPYWNENGVTIADPDGYRVVISPLKLML